MGNAPNGMLNFNGNILCALDTETTGNIVGYHEAVSVGLQPLDSDLEFAGNPFYIEMKPEYPDRAQKKAFAKNGFTLDYLIETGVDQQTAIDLFLNWRDKLGISSNKYIIPLAHNFAFDKGMMINWLGQDLWDNCFSWQSRCTMNLASSINDICNFAGCKAPFSSVSLKAICNIYGISLENAHNALADARACAKVYKCHLKSFLSGRV